ncbi:Lachrymatory-factor synthase [Actinidia chinensis var. chinensis]|uniref:Lachrymatory-factor synthase n=1 Tax=Actinidia chinensis var. chinensis TaxID=1590841 RepID=A0A2R6PHE7_ACTCC|nr:Lachrymatory-factor synthase [Actinidia chinensis var. chinensis]
MKSHKITLSLLSLFLSLSLMAEATPARWTGTVTAKVEGFSPAQVWPFFEDFSNLYKINPNVDISYALEGVYGHPGLVRFCSTHTTTKSPIRRRRHYDPVVPGEVACHGHGSSLVYLSDPGEQRGLHLLQVHYQSTAHRRL